MSCTRESLLTTVTRLPGVTLILFGLTPALEIVIVVVSTGVVVVVVGDVGDFPHPIENPTSKTIQPIFVSTVNCSSPLLHTVVLLVTNEWRQSSLCKGETVRVARLARGRASPGGDSRHSARTMCPSSRTSPQKLSVIGSRVA